MIVNNLPELMPENKELLAHLLLMTMNANGFKVDGVAITFEEGKC